MYCAHIGNSHRLTQFIKRRNPHHAINHLASAGLMGAGIAQVTSVQAGLPVVMKDRTRDAVVRGEKQIADELNGAYFINCSR